MRPSALVRLYPRSWQRRYGDEMRALLEGGPLSRGDRLDLVRGALDAWLHPASPSRIPAAAALVGGGLWTVVAAGVVFQPTPLDWPGYLVEVLLLAALAAAVLLVATLGCALRAGDRGGSAMAVAASVAAVGYIVWLAAIVATTSGSAEGATLAAAQTRGDDRDRHGRDAAHPVRRRRDRAPRPGRRVAMLIPWTLTWLVFGAAWTAIGIALVVEGPARPGSDWETRGLRTQPPAGPPPSPGSVMAAGSSRRSSSAASMPRSRARSRIVRPERCASLASLAASS